MLRLGCLATALEMYVVLSFTNYYIKILQAHRKYHYSVSPMSIPGIVVYILPMGRSSLALRDR